MLIDRWVSKAHHAGFDNLLSDGDVDRVRYQILMDQSEIYNVTPPDLQPTILHVLTAMKDFGNSIFEVCTKE